MTFIRRIAALALLASLGVAGGESASAQAVASLPAATEPLAGLGDARPIAAWAEYCRRTPADCAVDRSEPAVIALTPRIWQQIVSVNKRVNATIRPMTDQDHWGVADRWDIPTDGYGDCEDYQLLKRKLLVELGLSRRAMRMTVVVDEQNQGHAVMTVRTTLGDFVLDNKTDAVKAWYETGYIYVKRESQDQVAWTSLGGAVSPITTATR